MKCPRCGCPLSDNDFIFWCDNPTDSHVFYSAKEVEKLTTPDRCGAVDPECSISGEGA